ncbi:fused histidine kinase/response regulator receiver domain protein [Rivularia sp. PCC 7116]|uniref:hybrid sensor histidine kinase/response regulator n=1 Tax=Rivularia sp. PCC 7116 TaxID=373994 RepID=UPI00029F3074|nr:ATP-binding protein [Rivularia sp. PCC 7116]AFY54524.1 fused histidine kinase/response regulator receiver domain protein [Rivularia sp. PCC 7116]
MTYKLLFVDDEKDLKELIFQKFRKQIKKGEYQVLFALNGIEALEQVSSHPDLDLVITDINMPGMDGLELLAKLKDIQPNFKTIVVSGGGMDNIQKAMDTGAFDFLTKPMNLSKLEQAIKKTLFFSQQINEKHKQLQQVEQQLIQSEKMSALGQLVAEVAHEINNPLSYISANTKHAAEYLRDIFELLTLYKQEIPHPGTKITDKIEEIDLEYLMDDLPKLFVSMQNGTERIRDISDSLRTFARADNHAKTSLDIHQAIDNTLLILKHRLKANSKRPQIKIIKNYGNLPLVECYPGQIDQVLINLLSNAIDALDESNQGCSFADIQNLPNQITINTSLSEDMQSILIKIQDNGVGIPIEKQNQIFDNLFTTKPVGKGTGLGLSISYQIIVEKHNGKLWCESLPGEGATFVIQLPG